MVAGGIEPPIGATSYLWWFAARVGHAPLLNKDRPTVRLRDHMCLIGEPCWKYFPIRVRLVMNNTPLQITACWSETIRFYIKLKKSIATQVGSES